MALSNKPNSDFTNMHSLWDGFGRYYIRSAIGNIIINNEEYQFRITQDNAEGREDIPTERRVFTEIASDLDMPHDHTAIYFPGFSETSAQAEGDLASAIFGSLRQKYKNPKLIGLNACGKGTRSYMENVDLISRIGLLDEIRDVRDMVWMLLQREKIQGDVSLISHSMGALNAMSSLGVLQNAGIQQVKMVQLMPCTDKIFGLALSGQFIWTVRRHIKSSLVQAVSRKGVTPVSESDHNRMMFSIKSKQNEKGEYHRFRDHWEASVPDSSLRFTQVTLNLNRLRSSIVDPNAYKEVKAYTFQGGEDRVIPTSMIYNQIRRLSRLGAVLPGGDKPFLAQSFPHAIPMRMTDIQRSEMSEFLNGVYINS